MLISLNESRTLSEIVSDLDLYSDEILFVNTRVFKEGYAVYGQTRDNSRVLFQVTFDTFIHYIKYIEDLREILNSEDIIISMYNNTLFINKEHKNSIKNEMLAILEENEDYEYCSLIINLFNEY